MEGDIETEQLSITDDFKTPAKDFCPPHHKLISDTIHEMELPEGFPLNHDWKRFP